MGYIFKQISEYIDDCNCLPEEYDIASITDNIDGVEVSILYGTTDTFEVKYKGESYHSYEDLIKEHKELDCKNWYEIVEEKDGWVEETPIFCFIYSFNNETVSLETVEWLNEEDIEKYLIEELDYIRDTKQINGVKLEDYKDADIEME